MDSEVSGSDPWGSVCTNKSGGRGGLAHLPPRPCHPWGDSWDSQLSARHLTQNQTQTWARLSLRLQPHLGSTRHEGERRGLALPHALGAPEKPFSPHRTPQPASSWVFTFSDRKARAERHRIAPKLRLQGISCSYALIWRGRRRWASGVPSPRLALHCPPGPAPRSPHL